MKGFSLVCFRMCCLRLVEYVVEYWQTLQLWSFFRGNRIRLGKAFLGSFSAVTASIFRAFPWWNWQQCRKLTEHRWIIVIWRRCAVKVKVITLLKCQSPGCQSDCKLLRWSRSWSKVHEHVKKDSTWSGDEQIVNEKKWALLLWARKTFLGQKMKPRNTYFPDIIPSCYGYSQIVPTLKWQRNRKVLGPTAWDFDKCQMKREHFTKLVRLM